MARGVQQMWVSGGVLFLFLLFTSALYRIRGTQGIEIPTVLFSTRGYPTSRYSNQGISFDLARRFGPAMLR